MENPAKSGTPWWFWIISLFIVIFELMGISNYLMMTFATTESLAAQDYTPEQITFMQDVPAFYTAIFALAVWGGLLGAILLLLRKKLAAPILAFSFVMVLVSFVMDFMGGTFDVLGVEYLYIMLAVSVVSLLSVIFAYKMKAISLLR